jgi:hypothetical protein
MSKGIKSQPDKDQELPHIFFVAENRVLSRLFPVRFRGREDLPLRAENPFAVPPDRLMIVYYRGNRWAFIRLASL